MAAGADMKRIRTSAPRIRRERRWPEDLPADPRDPDVVGADIIAEVASEHGASAAQVRLAWTLHRDRTSSPSLALSIRRICEKTWRRTGCT